LHLAEQIHLSPPQTLRRVRALEEKGVIRSYVAQINPESVGLGVMAFVNLSLDREQFRNVREVEGKLKAFGKRDRMPYDFRRL
jgi:Lrp/AsnC family leucine-responsive transcriptional regulator